jgi:small-conductance mechanosensitive channel
MDMTKEIEGIRLKTLKDEEKALKAVQRDITKARGEYEALNNEIVKAIGGNSHFTPEQLTMALSQKDRELTELSGKEKVWQEAYEQKAKEVEKFIRLQKMIPNWRNEFDNAPNEVRKMLISELLDSVLVYRDCIEINFKIRFDEFIGNQGM